MNSRVCSRPTSEIGDRSWKVALVPIETMLAKHQRSLDPESAKRMLSNSFDPVLVGFPLHFIVFANFAVKSL